MAWVTKDSDENYDAEQQKSYTKQEKAKNWWHYNKWIVVAVTAAVIVAAWLVKDTVFRTKPDYEVSYIGLSELPVDTAESLTAALQGYGEDLNGDGRVVVQLNQYTVDFDAESSSTDAYYQMAGVIKLSADIGREDGSYIFLVQDPEKFEQQTMVLQYLDGTLPNTDDENADFDWENMVYRWSDCPVLAGLDLGDFNGYTVIDDATGSSQNVLQDIYIGRRGYWTNADKLETPANVAMWQALTAGATPMAQATLVP